MTNIENSGIQTGNVEIWYKSSMWTKKQYKIIYQPYFVAVEACIQQIQAKEQGWKEECTGNTINMYILELVCSNLTKADSLVNCVVLYDTKVILLIMEFHDAGTLTPWHSKKKVVKLFIPSSPTPSTHRSKIAISCGLWQYTYQWCNKKVLQQAIQQFLHTTHTPE